MAPPTTRRVTRSSTTKAPPPQQEESTTSKSDQGSDVQNKVPNARGGKKRLASSSVGVRDEPGLPAKKVTKTSRDGGNTSNLKKPNGKTQKQEQKDVGSSKTKSATSNATSNTTIFPKSKVEFSAFTIATSSASSSASKKPAASSVLRCQRSDPDGAVLPSLIFTHGAGGDLSAPAMVHFSQGFTSTGSGMVMFEGNSNLKSRAAGFERILEHGGREKWWDGMGVGNADDKTGRVRKTATTATIPAMGGRSLGARAAVTAALQLDQSSTSPSPSPRVSLVLSSYPLISPSGDVRDQILLALPQNMDVLFISGDNDSMCPLDRLQAVRAKMKAPSWLVVVKGADHGMKVKGGKDLKTGCERVGLVCGWLAWRWCSDRDEHRQGQGESKGQGKKDDGRQMTVRWDGDLHSVVLDGWDGSEEQVIWD
ncbi:hypothetical protein PV10_04362 [Exophiala mesophila]|uniref:KANL3/Tex30 alpha/beta hydrolase-like domain-containing protein n=1 Tax=Exophiala mesophila TaxID=212818 RepID=A0A0D2A251_EXOME|nr:uncharacterized protein PV10_04362 [Exophiala mesophila]KIV93123.1 hypothetical protein PV10_04362 [Exophiala mesophila]